MAVDGTNPVLRCSETLGFMSARPRIMIDARMLVGRFSGVGRVVTRLVDELAKREDLRVVALCGSEPYPAWIGRKEIEIITNTFGRADRTAIRRLFWEETKLPAIIRRADVDLYHATWNSGVPVRCPVPAVLTIHDLIPWHSPKEHFATFAQKHCYRHAVRASARRAARVTTVSEYVRKDVLSRFGCEATRVVAIPNGVDRPGPLTAPRHAADRPYVLYVGGHEQRKNIAGVFKIMEHYWRRFDSSLELRLTGHIASLSSDAADVFHHLPQNAPLRFLGDPTDEELARLYSSADALLLLSHDEGFGLTVLEAMAHGCTVIAAANAALPEVVGDAGILVNPDDPHAVSDAVHRIRTSPAEREDLIRRGLIRASAFTWQTMAERILGLYQAVLSESVFSRGSLPTEAIPAGAA